MPPPLLAVRATCVGNPFGLFTAACTATVSEKVRPFTSAGIGPTSTCAQLLFLVMKSPSGSSEPACADAVGVAFDAWASEYPNAWPKASPASQTHFVKTAPMASSD